MKLKKLSVQICILIIILISCEKTMYVELSSGNNKIVVNGIITPTYGFWMNLSESTSISESNSDSYVPITNAKIDYYENENLIGSILHYNNGDYYKTDFKPQTNTNYKMVITADGLPEASVIVNIPEPVEIIDFDTLTLIRNTFYYNDIFYHDIDFYLNFSFKDPDTSGNYYMLGVYYYENDDYHPLNVDSEPE